jgi:hypothetical protein
MHFGREREVFDRETASAPQETDSDTKIDICGRHMGG